MSPVYAHILLVQPAISAIRDCTASAVQYSPKALTGLGQSSLLFPLPPHNMASAADMKIFLTQKVDPDLLHAWANNDVELEHQYALALVKITTLGRYRR